MASFIQLEILLGQNRLGIQHPNVFAWEYWLYFWTGHSSPYLFLEGNNGLTLLNLSVLVCVVFTWMNPL